MRLFWWKLIELHKLHRNWRRIQTTVDVADRDNKQVAVRPQRRNVWFDACRSVRPHPEICRVDYKNPCGLTPERLNCSCWFLLDRKGRRRDLYGALAKEGPVVLFSTAHDTLQSLCAFYGRLLGKRTFEFERPSENVGTVGSPIGGTWDLGNKQHMKIVVYTSHALPVIQHFHKQRQR